MRKNFLFGLLAIGLAGFGFGGVSMADCASATYDTEGHGTASNHTELAALLSCADVTQIDLSDNVEITSSIDYSVNHTNGLLINLGDYSITSSERGESDPRHYYIALYGNVEIRGNENSKIAIRLLDVWGNLTFTSGTIEPTDTELETNAGGAGFWINPGATAIINGGVINGKGRQGIVMDASAEVTINGGSITSKNSYAIANNEGSDSILTINGGTISSDAFTIGNEGILNINGGTIICTNDDWNAIDNVRGTLTMTNGTIQGGKTGIFTIGNGTAGSAKVTINGGEIKDFIDFGISGNGTIGSGGTVITISDVEINADGEGNLAIYHPQSGEMTIGGGTFKGKESAIEIRAGNLTINGGDFESTANSFSINPNGNGTTTVGAAVAVSQHTTNLPINVTINGGTFGGVKALYEEDVQDEVAIGDIVVSVTTGTFNGEVNSENISHFIAGGLFSAEPDASYIVEGKVAVQDGSVYKVVNAYTVKFDAGAEGVENPADQTVAHGDKAQRPDNPSNSGKVLSGWYLDDAEFSFDTPITSDITLTGKWEDMTASAGDAEDDTTYASGFVFEAEEGLNGTDTQESVEAAVASNNATATMEGVAELNVYSDEDDDNVLDSDEKANHKINSKVNFTSPVVVRIPVNATGSVKVKVRHNGETTFGIEGLTRNSGDGCTNGVATNPYDGSDIPVVGGYVEIYTCSASTFVAYTETANPAPSYSGGGGGGGSSKSSTKTETTDDTTADTTDADTTGAEEGATEANPTVSAEEQAAVAKFGQEQIDAYKWALANGITTMKTVEAARLDQPLTRAELAKMMVVYIQKVAGKDPVVTGDVTYEDVDESLGDLAGYIKLAYQYQIMGINADGTPIQHFNPHGLVTRGEYATVFSRVLFGDRFNKDGADFYTNHLAALEKVGILKNTTPTIQEIRGWVMLMMYRSSQNSENIQALVAETEEAAAEETASEETASEEAAAEETASEETASEETASEETASEETASEETASEETATEETPAEETPAEEAAE